MPGPPVFRFVDVPGMGYAETAAPRDGTATALQRDRAGNEMDPTTTTTTSSSSVVDDAESAAVAVKDRSRTWRGLLDRYLQVRDPLRVVLHLVDARHGITAVDREVSACMLVCVS